MDKKFEDLIEGDIDPICGGVIKSLVMKGNGFIVYLAEEHGICWSTFEYEGFPEDFGRVSNRVKHLEGITSNLLNGKRLKDLNYVLAQGMARVLDDKSSSHANQILDEVEKSINEQGKQILKISYIISSLITTVSVGLLMVFAWIFRSQITQIIDRNAFEILMASLCGGIGAFISSFIRVINFSGDVRLPRNTYFLEGFLRIFYGLIAGFVASLSIKSNILLGMVNDIDHKSMIVICFISTIAGASESLIPSIIKKVEEKV